MKAPFRRNRARVDRASGTSRKVSGHNVYVSAKIEEEKLAATTWDSKAYRSALAKIHEEWTSFTDASKKHGSNTWGNAKNSTEQPKGETRSQ